MATTILPLHFSFLTLLSAWCPMHWSGYKKFIYRIYSLITFTSLNILNIFQVSKLINAKDFSDFNNTFSFNLAVQAAIVKAYCLLTKRDKVIQLIGMFEADFCVAQDDFEKEIRLKHEKKCRKLMVILMPIFEVLVTLFMTAPLKFDIELRILPYPVSLPYSLSKLSIYWLSYVHHYFTGFYLGHVAVTSDLLATGFMWHLSAQFQVLEHRLQQLPGKIAESEQINYDKQILKECVQHHVHLCNMAELITDAFGIYVVCQFYADALAVCMSAYQLTIMAEATASDKFAFFLYMSIVLGRLYLMCSFGNAVTSQSEHLATAIFQIDWTSLSLELKKSLSLMILRSSTPIMIASSAFISLMLETFIKVVKISYSGYNLLKSSV